LDYFAAHFGLAYLRKALPVLGDKTNTASSLLVMMIMGGGIISLLQGYLAGDALLGIQQSYWVGVICFAYLAFFAWKVAKIHRAHGIGLQAENATAAEGTH
jgi:FHS family L-fucose permease-like MFS transporter